MAAVHVALMESGKVLLEVTIIPFSAMTNAGNSLFRIVVFLYFRGKNETR